MVKETMTPAQLMELRKAQSIAQVLPDLDDTIKHLQQVTIRRATEEVRAGTLTPERAMSYWMEMHSYQRLNANLASIAAQADYKE